MKSSTDLRPNLRPWLGGRHAVPTILQMETTECGAACLGMILAFHGKWVPLDELRVRCGVSRDGANGANLLRTAREYGLVAKGFRCARERLYDVPFPMILFWEFSHFVVLEGMRGGRYYVNDPEDGPRRITAQEFEESYAGVCFGFRPGPGFRRGGSRPRILRGLRARFGHALAPLAFTALATLALLIPGLAVPTMLKVFVDDVLIRQNGDWVGGLLIGLALAAMLQGALVWLQRVFLSRMKAKLAIVTTTRFFWHVATLPMTFFSQRYAGDLAGRVMSNNAVAQLLSGELAVNAVNLLAMVFYAAVMLAYDVPLTLVVVAMAFVNLAVLRLAARALARKPRIILFDEATSALDNRSQAIVQASLKRLSATRIVIAHRLSSIRDVDHIFVMDAGRIVESGRYDDIIRRDGVFAALACRQLVQMSG